MFRRPVFQLSTAPKVTDKEIAESILNKIVEFLKNKFLERDEAAFHLDELLTIVDIETTLLDRVKQVLIKDVIPINPRVKLNHKGKLVYRPPLYLSTTKDLLNIIKQRSKRCEGVMEDEVMDSVPCASTIIRSLENDGSIFTITRMDSKKALFYKRKNMAQLNVDDQIKNLFHSVEVKRLHSVDIEKYLVSHKIKPLESVKFIAYKATPKRKRTLQRVTQGQSNKD